MMYPAPVPPPPRADAYFQWSAETGYRDVGASGPDSWISLIVQLRGAGDAIAALAGIAARCDWLRVPGHYAGRAGRWRTLRHCTLLVTQPTVALLAGARPPQGGDEQALFEAVERFEICFATDDALAAPVQDQVVLPGRPDGASVLVGVIDDGIAFANQRFCRHEADGLASRLLAFWDQDRPAPPAAFWPGRVHVQSEITAAIGGALQAGGVYDEEAVYRALGYQEVRRRATHGTHVLDLCAGEAPADPAARHAAIVAVQLPGRAVEDTSCGSMAAHIIEGLHFILRAAEAARLPAVVNISMGNIAGPHDGSSLFDQALDELVRISQETGPALQVVMPEGNSYLSRCHARADMEAGEGWSTMALDWVVSPDDGTTSAVELWVAPPDSQPGTPAPPRQFDLRLSIAAPRGGAPVAVTLLGAGAVFDTQVITHGGRPVGRIGLYAQPANGAATMGLITLAPTAITPDAGPRDTAPCGRWTLTVQHRGEPLAVSLYVQRDDVAFGRRGRGRQSHLEDPGYRRFDARGAPELADQPESYVRRVGTLNGMATGRAVHVVGGLLRVPGGVPTQAPYSAVGWESLATPAPASRTWAISEDSPVLHGILASGTRSGTLAALSGTSTAAPQHARALAAQMVRVVRGRKATPPPVPKWAAKQAPDANGKGRKVLLPHPALQRRTTRRLA